MFDKLVTDVVEFTIDKRFIVALVFMVCARFVVNFRFVLFNMDYWQRVDNVTGASGHTERYKYREDVCVVVAFSKIFLRALQN